MSTPPTGRPPPQELMAPSSASTPSSTTPPPPWSSTARPSPPPRRNGSAGASTARRRCRSRRGSCRSRRCAGARPRRPRRRATSTPSPTPTTPTSRPAGPGRPTSPTTSGKLRTLYVRRVPQFLATALPGLRTERVATSPTTWPTRRRPAWPPRRHVGRARARREGRGGLAPGRPVARRGARRAGRPAAAALAGPALRGGHGPPRVPAVVRRVQGDGARQLRRPRPLRPGVPRPWRATGDGGFRVDPIDLAALVPARRPRRGRGPTCTPTWPPPCRSGSRRSCSTWPAGCTTARASGRSRWPAAWRSTAWPTAGWPPRARSSTCGCSRRRAMPGTALGAALAVAATAGRGMRAVHHGRARPGLGRRRDRGRPQGGRAALRAPGRPGRDGGGRPGDGGGGRVVPGPQRVRPRALGHRSLLCDPRRPRTWTA